MAVRGLWMLRCCLVALSLAPSGCERHHPALAGLTGPIAAAEGNAAVPSHVAWDKDGPRQQAEDARTLAARRSAASRSLLQTNDNERPATDVNQAAEATWDSSGPSGVRWINSPLPKKDVSTAIFVVRTDCPGIPRHSMSVAEVERMAFDGPRSLTSLFHTCSYGRSRLTRANSQVVEVHLRCNDTMQLWLDNPYGHGYNIAAAVAEAAAGEGYDLSPYTHKLHLLPSECTDTAWAVIGGTLAWVCADSWYDTQLLMHELLHNLGLGEANGHNEQGQEVEYADPTCVMGYSTDHERRCLNTAHAWQVGWIRRLRVLTGADLAPGVWMNVTLGSQSVHTLHNRGVAKGLLIRPDWAARAWRAHTFFVGYRTHAGGDMTMAGAYAGNLTVHSVNVTGGTTTVLEGAPGAGQAWGLRGIGLVVRHHPSSFPNHATASVCRMAGPETADSCRRGIDNDCDGLVGTQDDNCKHFLAAPPISAAQLRPGQPAEVPLGRPKPHPSHRRQPALIHRKPRPEHRRTAPA